MFQRGIISSISTTALPLVLSLAIALPRVVADELAVPNAPMKQDLPKGIATEQVISEQAIASLIQNVTVAANIAGQVISVPFAEGDVIATGDVLVQLNDLAARADYQAAQRASDAAHLKASNDVNARYAQRTMEVNQAEYQKSEAANHRYKGTVSDTEMNRLRLVVDQGLLSMEQASFDQRVARAEAEEKAALADAALIRLQDHAIKAPVSGMIAEQLVQVGQHVESGAPLLRIIDLNTLRIECRVSEELSKKLTHDATVVFRVEGDQTVLGQIDFISPEVHPVTHEVRVTAKVDTRDHKVRPGTHGKLLLIDK